MEKVIEKKTVNPTPEERPDLYDYYDGGGLFRHTGVATPDRIKKLIDARQAKMATKKVSDDRS